MQFQCIKGKRSPDHLLNLSNIRLYFRTTDLKEQASKVLKLQKNLEIKDCEDPRCLIISSCKDISRKALLRSVRKQLAGKLPRKKIKPSRSSSRNILTPKLIEKSLTIKAISSNQDGLIDCAKSLVTEYKPLAGSEKTQTIQTKPAGKEDSFKSSWTAQIESPALLLAKANVKVSDSYQERQRKIKQLVSTYFPNLPDLKIFIFEKAIQNKSKEKTPEPTLPKKVSKPKIKKPKVSHKLKLGSESLKLNQFYKNITAIREATKAFTSQLAANILKTTNCKPNLNSCVFKLVQTSSDDFYLIILGGKLKLHNELRSKIKYLDIGEQSSDKSIKYNGHGYLECSVYRVNSHFADQLKAIYERIRIRRENKTAFISPDETLSNHGAEHIASLLKRRYQTKSSPSAPVFPKLYKPIPINLLPSPMRKKAEPADNQDKIKQTGIVHSVPLKNASFLNSLPEVVRKVF